MDVEPLRLLRLGRERSTALPLERFKRMEDDNLCRQMVDQWKPKERIKKASFLKAVIQLATQNRFPEERKTLETISSYPKNTIHRGYGSIVDAPDANTPLRTLWSAYIHTFRHTYLTKNKGLTDSCGVFCTNYDADVVANNKKKSGGFRAST